MKTIFFISTIIISLFAHAQTVKKVSGNEAFVNLEGQTQWKVGDSINFLSENLSISGQGEITKVSSGGSKALIKITSGKAAAGMTVEKQGTDNQSQQRSQKEPESNGISYSSLTEHEREILRRGEVSDAQYIFGGILGTYPGLGLGHAIQGRYMEKGWMFTVGESVSAIAIFAGIGDCWNGSRYSTCNPGLVGAGFVGLITFRIWEIFDVWATPLEQNRHYRELKGLLRENAMTFEPALIPTADGGRFGLKLTF
ncbi:MAG: hypothetical protein ACXVCY_10255 [Pseudobdellovibrionaceae bacterium]